MTSVQEWLASVTGEPVDPDVSARAVVVRSVRDISSVAVRAQATGTMAAVRRYIEQVHGGGEVPIWGTGLRADAVSAAFANAAAAQAIEYDDVAPSCVAHVGAVMVPAVASLAHRMETERTVSAYVVGQMVIDHFASGFFQGIYAKGLQPTGVLSTLGTVAALLHGINARPNVRMNAFGLVATHLLGLRSHTGTNAKGIQAATASAAAVRSVLLAEADATAGADAIDVVLRLLGLDSDDLIALARGAFRSPVVIAPRVFPTNGAAHTAIEGVLDLRDQFGERAGDPSARIAITSPPEALNALSFSNPATPDEARFSMPFAAALAWLHGSVRPDQFNEETVASPELKAMMEHVTTIADPELSPPPSWCGFPAVVDIECSGQHESVRIEEPLGYPDRPISDAQFEAKFVECTSPLLPEPRAAALYAAADGLDPFGTLNTGLSAADDSSLGTTAAVSIGDR